MDEQSAAIVKGGCMAVATEGGKPRPLRFFSIVDLNKRHSFFGVVGPSSHNHQIGADKGDQMLVAAKRSVCFWFWWGDPVPGAISVLPEAPNVIECCDLQLSLRAVVVFFCLFTASEHDHHAQSRPLFADGSRVVHSRCRHYFILKLVFLPWERSFEDVEQPYVIFCPISRVSSKNDEEGLVEEHCMTVSLTRCGCLWANFDDFPYGTEWV